MCRGIHNLLCLCLVLAGAHFSFGGKFASTPLTYRKYRLYEVTLETNLNGNIEETLPKLLALRASTDSLIFLDDVFWPGKVTHVVAAPHKALDFELALIKFGLHWNILSDDYTYYVTTGPKQMNSVNEKYDWTSYYMLNNTYDFLHRLQSKNPSILQNMEIGRSRENQPIIVARVTQPDTKRRRRSPSIIDIFVSKTKYAVTLSAAMKLYAISLLTGTDMDSYSETETEYKEINKPTIFIEAGMHGNTWITSAVATYVINELVTSSDPKMSLLTQHFNWLILPHANPDGYVHTDTSDPLWSRTRSRYAHCIGVDPNRNFDVDWEYSNKSHTKCNKNYRGPYPFTEIETRSLAEAIVAGVHKIDLYISLHFGERVLESFDKEAVKSGKDYVVLYKEDSSDKYDASTHGGSSVAWASETARIANAFNLEIKSKSMVAKALLPGTQVPESDILGIAKDTLNTLIGLAIKHVPPGSIELSNPFFT